MKKQNLNEQVSRMKQMMGLNENESQGDNVSDDKNFKVGDIVMNPVSLSEDPSYYGKILEIFPNLESAKDQPSYDLTVKYLGDDDPNDVFYLIDWKSEGIGLYPKEYLESEVELAPNPELYDEKDEDEDDNDEEDGDMCSNCNGTGEGQYDGSRCSSCGGSGVIERDYDDYDGPDDYDDYDVRAKEWGGMDF